MMRKCGLLTLRPTEQNKSCTLVLLALTPLMRYLFLPPITTLKTEGEMCKSFSISFTVKTLYRNYRAFKNHGVFFFPHLSGDGDLIMGFKPQRTLAFVGVVKGNRHSGLGDTTLSIFVNQVLEVGGSNLSSENETKGYM